jgi:hypothetical protein
MSYTVEVVRPAEKFLRGLTDKKLYQRLRETIKALKENPRPVAVSSCQGERISTGCGSVIIGSFIKFKIKNSSCSWFKSAIAGRFNR